MTFIYLILSFFLAVGEWLLILPRHASHTAGFAQPLRHIARASSSPMLPNTVLTRSQLGMAEPGFEPTTLRLDIWSGFELHFLAAQVRTAPDGSDRPTAIVSYFGAEVPVECMHELIQASTASAILKYQPPISTRLQPLQRWPAQSLSKLELI